MREIWSKGQPYQASIYEKTALIGKRIREIESGKGPTPYLRDRPIEEIATYEILHKKLVGQEYYIRKEIIQNGELVAIYYPLADIVFV